MLIIIIAVIVIIFAIAFWRTNRNQNEHTKKVNDSVNTITDTDNTEVQLKHLKELLDTGVIDREDYEQSKQQILHNKL
ncbi:SHOCT domain-containing protein [Nicoliella lavandulae]|uniref:SHOCT domain-containing protein n=1 Tax=Nicoliella lavandulae TaxID=3082954 RepID=A0ABU8SKD2_9LACO